jgi:xylulose-5-phosphate/fructose-6-phosphate phosphoketolase
MQMNEDFANFRVFGPDEDRLEAVLETSDPAWMAAIEPGDDLLAPNGRVLDVLSEHLCRAG